VHLYQNEAALAIALAGQSLHRRGYQCEQVKAPLKENLAAAILWRGGVARRGSRGRTAVDPMCGSGTPPIEAALIAGDSAPSLTRDCFGFTRWRQQDSSLWPALLGDAMKRRPGSYTAATDMGLR
jgi:23S rRNA (guanine2445-N2)-methyltransferase / 23S rRNA (guanine2069-N7)-methyltransferase